MKTYLMSDDEIEAAIYNWLDQSGSYILDKFPHLEPSKVIHEGMVIYFEEPPYNEG